MCFRDYCFIVVFGKKNHEYYATVITIPIQKLIAD